MVRYKVKTMNAESPIIICMKSIYNGKFKQDMPKGSKQMTGKNTFA